MQLFPFHAYQRAAMCSWEVAIAPLGWLAKAGLPLQGEEGA